MHEGSILYFAWNIDSDYFDSIIENEKIIVCWDNSLKTNRGSVFVCQIISKYLLFTASEKKIKEKW